MAMRYPGGLIATSPVNAAYPSGVWTQSQTIPYASQNVWQNDQYWPYTTLLLHGDGTNGAQNNTFLDSGTANSGSGFTITRNGNTTQGAFTPFQQNGYWSNYFNGSSDYFYSVSTDFDVATGDFTAEGWIFPTGDASGSYGNLNLVIGSYASDVGSNANGAWYLGVNSSSKVIGGFFISGTFYSVTSSASVSLNTWQHVAFVRNGNDWYVYLNGVRASTTQSGTVQTQGRGSVGGNLVNGQTGYQFKGYISNVRFVKGTAVYTAATITVPTAPLTAITNTKFLTCQANRFVDANTQVAAKTITLVSTPSVQAFQPFPGPTTWSASVLGGSGYFDGTGDYLTVETAAESALNLTGTFTFEFWFYRNATGDIQLFSKGGGQNNWNTTNGIAYQALIETSTFKWQFSIGGGSLVSIDVTAPAISQWVHVAVGRNGTTTRVWVNGSSIGTSTSTPTPPSTRNIIYAAANQTGGNNVNGYMAGLRIVNGTDVYGVSNTSITVPTSPPTNISNTSLLLNFTNAGIFDNAQMNDLETVGNAQVSTSVVKYGTGSMAFDGSGDYLLAPSNPNFAFGTGEFTVEMWLYPTASFGSGGVNIVGINSSGGGLLVGGTNKIAWNLFGTGDLVAFSSFTSSYNNVWTHVAYTRSGTTGRLFINGMQQASGTDSTNYTVTTNFAIGAANNGNQAYIGYIDDLRITKGVARYISNFTPPIARMPNQ